MPRAFGGTTREVYSPCQGDLKRSKGLDRSSVPPTPSEAAPGAGTQAQSSDPAAEYVRRNHLMYSGVARTTSPCSEGVVVYVSKGGALPSWGRPPKASFSSLSLMFSRLLIGVGVPCGGKGAPVNRLQPAGLYVALPVTSTLTCSSDASNEVTHDPPGKRE